MNTRRLNQRLDNVEDDANAGWQAEKVQAYREACRRSVAAKIARLRGNDVDAPDEPPRPDCLPEPTGEARRKLARIFDRYRDADNRSR
jgi:hypothetical protein